MLSKEDANRLYHMLEAAREAVAYAHRQDLETDRPLTHSLVRCLEVVGEAASQVSAGCRRAYPEVAWDDMVGMRNRLIHAYFDVNLNIVWRTVQEELPILVGQLEGMVRSSDVP
jgi:uncharacterized protein with HEPN domain